VKVYAFLSISFFSSGFDRMSSIFLVYEFGFFSSAIIPLSLERTSFAYVIGVDITALPQPIA